jgi:hypothetical protein
MRLALLLVVGAFLVPSTASGSSAYSDSRFLCHHFGVKAIAREYHAKAATAKSAASAYARASYRANDRHTAYRGCLAGFAARH